MRERGCHEPERVSDGGALLRDRPSRLRIAPQASARPRKPTRWRAGNRSRRRSRRGGSPSNSGPDGCSACDAIPRPGCRGLRGSGGRSGRLGRDAARVEAGHRAAAEASAAAAAAATSTTTAAAATTTTGTLAADQHQAGQRLWRQKPRPHRPSRSAGTAKEIGAREKETRGSERASRCRRMSVASVTWPFEEGVRVAHGRRSCDNGPASDLARAEADGEPDARAARECLAQRGVLLGHDARHEVGVLGDDLADAAVRLLDRS